MSAYIGIDLGTTNSVIAYIDNNNKPQIIKSKENSNLIPSVVLIDKNKNIIVGEEAIKNELNKDNITIRSIKRKIGTSERIEYNNTKYSPEEISAEILKKIKKDAELFLKQKVTEAVITVPAYFNNNQRQSTKIAGELAGLKVLRIINEPTAAALAYGLGNNINETILVFDLGGGTFDISILKITDDNIFEVLSTCGDTQLGGDDFDNAIWQDIIQTNEIVETPILKIIGKIIAEKIKIILNNNLAIENISLYNKNGKYVLDYGEIEYLNENINEILQNYNIIYTISQNKFNSLIDKFLNKIKSCMLLAITEANLQVRDIDKVILVGGSTRVNYIRNKLKEFFNKEPLHSVDPDLAVAIGAAIQAHLIKTKSSEALLIDVTPLTIGIETLGGVMTPMITRNTTIPVEKKEIFTTAEDNQQSVAISIYQGERPQVKYNKLIGRFLFKDIPPMPKGNAQIEVTFDIDNNGILTVTAEELSTNKKIDITITGVSSLTNEEIEKILKDAEQNKENDEKFIKIANLQNELRCKIIQIDNVINNILNNIEISINIKEFQELKQLAENYLTCEDEQQLTNIIKEINNKISLICEDIYEEAEKMF